MNKFLRLFYLISFTIFLTDCSFKNPGNFFEDNQKKLEKEIFDKNSKLVFSPQKTFKKEISGEALKEIQEPLLTTSWIETNLIHSNLVPNLKYSNEKRLVHKSKKIGKNKFNLSNFNFEPLIFDNNIFLSDLNGSIYNFSADKRKLNWKFNFYKKRYKNLPIFIKLRLMDNVLIVSDNLGYVYAINVNNGEINWAKNYGIPFNSNLKLDEFNIFLLNQDNKYFSIDAKDGSQKLSLETFPSFIKSIHETPIAIDNNNKNVYFITSNGEIYSINYLRNNINWFFNFSLSNNTDSDLFFSSPLVLKNNSIFFSSSVSTYSIDATTGAIKWALPFSTHLRPIVSDNYVFLASKNGFFLNLDLNTGEAIWSKDIFKNKKKFNQKKIGDIVSLLLVSDQILAITSKGFFVFIDYRSGKVLNYTKASKAGFFSGPSVVNEKIYILDKKMRLLVFN